MILEIGLGITGIVTAINIVKNVRLNLQLTKDLSKKEKSKLMWRYGPFTMDEYAVQQHKLSLTLNK